MTSLSLRKCRPCKGNTHQLTPSEIITYAQSIPQWKIIKRLKIRRQFALRNFTSAIEFINKIGVTAQEQGHHPDICLTNYKEVTVALATHSIKGLSINDFILASKIDHLL